MANNNTDKMSIMSMIMLVIWPAALTLDYLKGFDILM